MYSLAYNRDQEINTPFAKEVRDNSGMATFDRVSAAGLCKLMALLGHKSERKEGRGGKVPLPNKSNVNHISNNSFKIDRDHHHRK